MTTTAERLSCVDVDAVSALLPVVGGNTTVPLVDGSQRVYANLDYAASAPALEAVAARVTEVLPLYASVHRGAGLPVPGVHGPLRVARARRSRGSSAPGPTTSRSSPATRPTRSTCWPASSRPVPGSSCSTSSTTPTCCPGCTRRTATATRRRSCRSPRTVAETLASCRDELARQHYALLTVTGASNVTGESLPLDEVIALAHAEGARVAVDGAQLVPHRGFSLAASDADYIAFSGHKTYAPFGAGALVGRRDWLDTGAPYLAGGGAVRDVRTDRTVWQPAPARHEAGSPNVHRRDRARGGLRPARRPSRRRADRARGGPARAARRRAVARSTASRSRASGPTPPRPSASSRSPSRATTRASSPPTCRPSTASASATAASAPTRSWPT